MEGQSVAVEEFAVQDQDSTLAQLQEDAAMVSVLEGNPGEWIDNQ